MNNGDIVGLVAGLAPAIRDYLEEALSPLVARVADLEARAPLEGPPGRDGKDGRDGIDADPALIRALVMQAVDEIPRPLDGHDGKDGADGRDGQDGKDADPEVLHRAVIDEVAKIPRPQDGKDGADGRDGQDGQAGRDADPEVVRSMVSEAVAALPPAKDGRDGKDGQDGKDVDFAEVRRAIAQEAASLVNQIPRPQDGRSVTVEDVAPMLAEMLAKAVAALPVPRDGVGISEPVIDSDGTLVLTMTDGSLRRAGLVKGRDVDMGFVQQLLERRIVEEVAKIPPPKDGKDGLGFQDMDVIQDGRKIVFRFALDGQERTFELFYPVPLHRGIWREGQVYEHGDTVTWAGSLWHANANTPDKPGDGSQAWTLVAKRGRDGKDGRNGKDGERGPPGRDGRVA